MATHSRTAISLFSGEQLMHVRGRGSARPCKECGGSFCPRTDALKRGMGLFCGAVCSAKHRRGSKFTDKEIVDLYLTGLTMKEVSVKTGMGWRSVQRRVHTAGAKINPNKRKAAPCPSKKGRKVYQWVAEHKYGRKLKKGECVHHINLDRTDNTPGNLAIMTRSEHCQLHNQLQRLAADLINKGVIVYEDVENKYKTSPQNISELNIRGQRCG